MATQATFNDVSKDKDLFREDDHIETLKDDLKHTYARNVRGEVRNPLHGISRDQLFSQVRGFANAHGLSEHIETFEKGALVAQNPEAFEDIPELNEQDKYHLRREITHKWHLSKALYSTVALCSLGSAIQGWDNTGANGANLSWPTEFGIADNTWLIGFVNSAPTITGLSFTWLADPLNAWVGRRGAIFVTGLFCIFPILGQGLTRSWWELLLCRLIMGIGMAVKITTIPVMTAEIVPASVRGGLVMFFQLWVAFGILIGLSANLVFYRIGDLAWRFQIGAAFAPAIPIVIWIWFVPESPRWLLKKHRIPEAYASFRRLRTSDVIAARDLFYAFTQFSVEEEVYGGSTFFQRAKELFTVPRIRRATYGGAIVMMAQQFSGISVMSFYSSTVFAEAGRGIQTTLLASWGFGLINFVFAFPAIWTIDTFGRRNLLLFTFPNMAWCLVTVGCLFLLPTESQAKLPLVALFIYIYTAMYSPGIGPVPNVYASECFPLSHREIGSASSIFVNNFLSTIFSLTFPSILAHFKPTGAFCFFAGLNMTAFVIIFFFLPETKQRTLEELDYIFAVPTSRHAAYQGRTWLPWFLKRWVFFRKEAKLEPLYNLEGVVGGTMPPASAH